MKYMAVQVEYLRRRLRLLMANVFHPLRQLGGHMVLPQPLAPQLRQRRQRTTPMAPHLRQRRQLGGQ